MEQKKVIVKRKVEKPVIKKESFLDKVKKNWKIILIIILLLFSLSKCTSSCTRGKQIDRLTYQIEQRDSIINANGIELDKLSTRLDDARTSIDNYKGIATGNQKELIDKVQNLTTENNELNKKVKQLSSENASLKKQIKDLENNIDK